VAEALTAASQEDEKLAILQIVLLAQYGLFFGALLTVRLRAQYRGEDLSDGRNPAEFSQQEE